MMNNMRVVIFVVNNTWDLIKIPISAINNPNSMIWAANKNGLTLSRRITRERGVMLHRSTGGEA